MIMEEKKIKRKKFTGVVVSDSMDKTVVVSIPRYIKHKLYGKYFKMHKKLKAHDEKNEYKKGDRVVIEECRPVSKEKKFKTMAKT